MSAKHTPGPWKVYRRADYTTPGWVILWPDSSKPGVHHRRVDSNGGFIEEDARLIAAAPDLLEIVRISIGNVRSLGPAGSVGPYTEYRAWLEQLEAAYARASGEPS